MIEYILLGVFAPIILNLMHLVLGVWITVYRGSVIGLGFSAVGFVTKTIGMLFFTWLGIVYLNLEVGIYIYTKFYMKYKQINLLLIILFCRKIILQINFIFR